MTMLYFDKPRPPPRPARNFWAWWQAKLAGLEPGNPVNEPQCGFYRKAEKERYGARRTFVPVAYYPGEGGQIRCRIGEEDVGPDSKKFLETWPRVLDQPVTEEAFRTVAENGGLWPDEHELVDMRGHNRPPEDVSFEGLRDAIDPLSKDACIRLTQGPVQSQDEADRIANLADRLSELAKQAEDIRKEERKPHDEALKEIQKRWTPLILAVEVYKRLKYELLTPWLKREEARQKEEAEAAAAAGEPAAAETRRPRAGTRGRAQTLKATKKAQIDDYAVCLDFFKDSEDIR